MEYSFEIEDKNKLKTVKAILKALSINIKAARRKTKGEEYPYSEEFRKDIERGREDIKAGRTSKLNIEKLWNEEHGNSTWR